MIHKQLFNDSIKQQLKRNEDNSYFLSNRPRTSMSRAMLLIFNISIRYSLNSLHQNFGSAWCVLSIKSIAISVVEREILEFGIIKRFHMETG